MKILVVSHTYIAPINREKWKVFANNYKDSKIKVLIPKFWVETFFNIDAGDCSNDNLDNCEFIPLKIRKSGNEVLYNYRFIDLFRILKKFKPDIIHVEQGDNALSYFQLIFLSKLLGLKSKFTFFTWVNWKHNWSLKYKLVWKFIEKFNLKHSSGAFVGNFDAQNILHEKKFYKPMKTLLQLGVNTKYFSPKDEQILKFNLQSRVYKIGFIGRIVKEKGVFDLLKAFAKLKINFNNWQLIFIGSGNDKELLLKKIVELNLTDFVKVFEPVKHEQVGNLLNEFDIFVLPSYDTSKWREQFGHVLIEAMACKVPIIGSTGGEIPNVIGDAGLIFKQNDVDDLIQKLSLLMSDKNLRKEFGLKGSARFKNNFSYDIIAKETYNFWKEGIQN